MLKEINQSKNTNYITSKSFIFFENELYPLSLSVINNVNYPAYIFAVDKDITESLVRSDNFLGQFYNYNHDSSMATITFGLDGFTEALAAYNKICNKQ